MTWDARDLELHQTPLASALRRVIDDLPTALGVPASALGAPTELPATPRVARAEQIMALESQHSAIPLALRREMEALGLITEQSWTRLSKLMARGIVSI